MFTRLSTGIGSNVNKTITKWVLCLALGCTLYSCGSGVNAPDVSDVKVELKTQRLDKGFSDIDTVNIAASLLKLRQQYPRFFDFYLDTLMGLGVNGNYNDSNVAIREGVHSFLTHNDYRGLLDTVAKHYPDTKDIDASLQKGFQYMKHYMPAYHVPEVVYIVSWLNNWAAFTYDTTTVGIGLDMFLGPDYPFYKAVGIPAYWSEQLRPEYIPVATFKAIYRDKHEFVMGDRNLLDMMIQRGKEMYFIDHILPEVPANTKLAFTEKQLKWCEANETMMYNFFVQGNFLYETSLQKVARYVNEGPNAVGMSEEGPGNVGTWMGWQIVKAYAAQHPDMTLEQIINDKKDAQQVLQESKYKPK